MECLDCVETVARLHLYLDRELSEEEIIVVRQHLESCPHCECRFHFDMSIKRLIHERCAFERAPEHLRLAVLRLARGEATTAVIDRDVEIEIRSELAE
jgi:mycothiol system anti-sigma-R factor